MTPLLNVAQYARKLVLSTLVLAGFCTFGVTLAFSSSPNSETIAATATEAGQAINVTLTIDSYSTPADMQVLSAAFQEGQDQALVTALAKIKTVGHCSIRGAASYEVAFIQVTRTATGRRITFITNRPLQIGEANETSQNESYDLAIGEFELNDTDGAKSTGFLYPASKLIIDPQGEFHYDLGGKPLLLVSVLDSKQASEATAALSTEK
jgi:hypothetical protein